MKPPVECFHTGRPARQNGNKGQITITIQGQGSRAPNPPNGLLRPKTPNTLKSGNQVSAASCRIKFLFLQACRKAAFSALPSSWCMQTTPRMFSLKESPRPRTPMTPPCTASSAHQQQLSLSALHFKPGSITWQHGAPNGESSSSLQNHRH